MVFSYSEYCGEHILDDDTMIYTIKRGSGLFSNLSVAIFYIMKFKKEHFLPKNISLFLTEYGDCDFYLDLFKPNNTEIDFNDISENEVNDFFNYCRVNLMGIGSSISHFNFKIFNKIINKYFTFSDKCDIMLNQIKDKHNIDFSNTVFLWARKTDKTTEMQIPKVETYLELIENYKLNNFDIILQTDDLNVLNEFKNSNLKFKTLEEIPYSQDSNGFHNNLNFKHNDESFEQLYNMSKVEYLQKLLCLAKISAMCKYSITYPGCLTTFIPILNGSFENKLSFRNDRELIT